MKEPIEIAMKQLAAEFINIYADKLCLLDQAIIDYTQLSSKAPSQHNAGVDDSHIASKGKIYELHSKVSALSEEHISLSKYDASQPQQWQSFFANAFRLMAKIQEQLGSFSIDFCTQVYDSCLGDVGSPCKPPSSEIFNIDRATQCEKSKFQEKQRSYYEKHLVELERLRRKVDELQQDGQESAASSSRKDEASSRLQVENRQRLVDEYLKSAKFYSNSQDRTTTADTPDLAQLITQIMTVKAYIDAGNLSGKDSKSIAECVQSMLCRYSKHSASLASEIRNAVNAHLHSTNDDFDAGKLANQIISIEGENQEKQPLYVMNHQLLRAYDSISDRLYALLGTIQRSFTTNFQMIAADVVKNIEKGLPQGDSADSDFINHLKETIGRMQVQSRKINERLKKGGADKTQNPSAIVENDSLWGQFYDDIIKAGVKNAKQEDIDRRQKFWGIREGLSWRLLDTDKEAVSDGAPNKGMIAGMVDIASAVASAVTNAATNATNAVWEYSTYLASFLFTIGSADVWKNSLVSTDSNVISARNKPELVRFIKQATKNDESFEAQKDSNLFFFWLYIKIQYLRGHVYISGGQAYVKGEGIDIEYQYHADIKYGSLLRLAVLNEGDVSVLASGLGLDIDDPGQRMLCEFLQKHCGIYCEKAPTGDLNAVAMQLTHGVEHAYSEDATNLLLELNKKHCETLSRLNEHDSLRQVIGDIKTIVERSHDSACFSDEVAEQQPGVMGHTFPPETPPPPSPPHNDEEVLRANSVTGKSKSSAYVLLGVGVAILVIAAVCCAVAAIAAVPAITFALPILAIERLGISSAVLTLTGGSFVAAGGCSLLSKKPTTPDKDTLNCDQNKV